MYNGTIYRDNVRNDSEGEDLVINKGGNFSIISESQVSIKSLNTAGVYQIIAFGPALVENGQISMLYYVIIVSDCHTSESEGISLFDLAQELKERGCTTAYNLDGG
ncbi:MAG: phosphodiester glycosidase family protein, partial [Eubacteriales bacterium]